MYGDIEAFSIKNFLDETYPTDDDSESKQKVIDYLTISLSKHKNVRGEDMDHFMDTLITRLRVISSLCRGIQNMDECDLPSVDDVSKSIDDDLKYILRNKNDIMRISNGTYFLDLSTFPDSVKFYKYLVDKNKIKNSISRRNLESIYNECTLYSNFSNVLFTLSWLGVLRVYSTNLIYFDPRCTIYF